MTLNRVAGEHPPRLAHHLGSKVKLRQRATGLFNLARLKDDKRLDWLWPGHATPAAGVSLLQDNPFANNK